ncbi:multidrug efflux MFS transporter [Francisella noatunensis]|uniref:Multidrug efflux MFS transporter n=1 Tax=Francisella noatunensis TaxID=657445 RepID=A0A9Q2QHT8_9GAMM|nr:MDR family MFS transporter [Francisella noatunensis]MBK2028445.1 multidrug efflux MFS transporter [Francisella noatunensis]MBK2033840.1 multidrug efflux MFS transporter [Francisella noatunensis]MBK2049344.1 multidrug efflux MFS transporter [Francisella noatunensis]MBK2050811.1 multidrug efflux MFS transporter [Francisella noatunensis]MBK2052087.1 multidrug efflux MFS transporter [Francisella noatunensis]
MQTDNTTKIGFWSQKRTIVALAISLLALAEIVDLTIVAVAIPQIMGAIGANVETIADVTTVYIVTAAIFILLSGLIIEKYGIKRVALVSSVIFGISSIMCGLSTSLAEMIVFRAFQGMGGAFLPSVAQTYISTNFRNEEYNKMMTVYSMVIVMGPIIGPVLGGAICENMSWEWIFYVNVPLCIVAFVIIFFMMDATKIKKIKIDYISFGFMAIGVGCLELFIDNGNTNGWFSSIEMIILLSISIVSLGFFIWRGLIYSSVVKFRIFKNFNFILACFLCFMFVLLFSAAMAYLPTMLQQVYGYPVDLAGYITAPRGVAAIFGSVITQNFLVKKLGVRTTISLGMLTFGASCLMQASFSPTASEFDIVLTTAIQGLGMMMFFVPFMSILVVGVADEDMGDMSGSFNFFRNFGSSVGTAFVATFISRNQQTTYQELSQNISYMNNSFQAWTNTLPIANNTEAIAIAKQQILHQSSLLSYVNSFYVVGILSLLLAIVPFLLKEPPKDAAVPAMH